MQPCISLLLIFLYLKIISKSALPLMGGGQNMGQEVRNKMKGVLKNLTEDDGVDSRK